MSDALAFLSRAAQVIRDLHINPMLLAVTLAIGLAWLEQKRVQRNTPNFTADHQGEASKGPRQAPR
jgi:hypothetical protein